MTTSLASILFKDYRRRVLGLLLLHPEQSYHVREIARLTGILLNPQFHLAYRFRPQQ